MFTTAIIAFREFLEAFLIVGVFLGVSRKLELKKEFEIFIAAIAGFVISLLLSMGVYIFGDHARAILTERNADALESYLLTFSGFFIAYVVFSLHKVIGQNRTKVIQNVQNRLKDNAFDITLFLTITFLVAREGFEIALFTASVSLFSAFMQNFAGLLLGFAAAAVIGITTFFAYIKFPISKVFKATEYMIILLGASLVQNGITTLLDTHFNIQLSDILSFHMQFLPDEDTFIGGFLQSFFGIDQGFSMVRLSIMLVYIGAMYFLFMRKKAVDKNFGNVKRRKIDEE